MTNTITPLEISLNKRCLNICMKYTTSLDSCCWSLSQIGIISVGQCDILSKERAMINTGINGETGGSCHC